MATIYKASRQWATRPSDERFTSLDDLVAHTRHIRNTSAQRVLKPTQIRAVAESDEALKLQGPSGHSVDFTHWSFGQLCRTAGAPAAYLRDLPAPLAAECINHGLAATDEAELGILLRNQPAPALGAVTGPSYGRIWNADVAKAIRDRFGNGLDGDFRIPGEFGKAVPVTKQNTTLYAGDRDMFVFLADENNRIEVPNRRNGQAGSLARGFFVWNSEVGSASVGIATFLFDYVCSNRIVWGATEYKEVRLRHTSGAPSRWFDEVMPMVADYSKSSAKPVEDRLRIAQATVLDDVSDFLGRRFTKAQAEAILLAHQADEGRPIETVWDAITGITAYARDIAFADKRVEVEREAGKLFDLVA